MAEIGAKVAIEVGSVINGRYDVLAELGQGGMGIVYKVRDTQSNKLLALKLLFANRVPDAQSVSRFNQEVRAASRLDHPNLTNVYDWGIAESGQPYMVMELVDGVTLATKIAQEGQISIDETLRIFIQVCDGLEHAHGHHVLHRDLKPSNIIITGSGGEAETVKILDFGLAKIQSPPNEQSLEITHTGQLVGTPFYMSPEQARGVRVDERSDLYSLGCSMYEALTGGPPHIGASPMSTLIKRENDPPPPLSEGSLGKNFPEQVEHVVLRLLNLVPEERFQSASEVKHALLRLLKGEPIDTSKSILTPAHSAIAQTASKRKIPIMVKVNFLLIILLAGISIVGSTAIYSSKQRQTNEQGRDDKDAFHTLPVYLPKEMPPVAPEQLDEIQKSRLLSKRGNLKGAEQTLLNGILDYRQKWGPGSHAEGPLYKELGELYLVFYKNQDKAYDALTKSYEILRKDLPEGSESLATLTSSLADSYATVQNPKQDFTDRRLELYQRAADIFGHLFPPRPVQEARCLSDAGEILMKMGDETQSEATLRKSVAILEKMQRPKLGLLFHARRRLSTSYRHQRRFAEALEIDTRTFSIVEANSIDRDRTLERCMVLNEMGLDNLGFVQDAMKSLDHKHLDAAEQLFEQSLQLSERDQSKYLRQRMTAFEGLGEVCIHSSKEGPANLAKANAYYQAALRLSLDNLGHEDAQTIYQKLAHLQLIAGNPAEQSKYFALALKAAPQSRCKGVLRSQFNDIVFYRATKKFDIAERMYKELEVETARLLGRSSIEYADVCAELGQTCLDQKRSSGANTYLRKALAIYQQNLGSADEKTKRVVKLLANK